MNSNDLYGKLLSFLLSPFSRNTAISLRDGCGRIVGHRWNCEILKHEESIRTVRQRRRGDIVKTAWCRLAQAIFGVMTLCSQLVSQQSICSVS